MSATAQIAATTAGNPTPFRVFDGDNHYYETYDSFTRYIEPKFADRAIHVRPNEKGRNVVYIGDTPLKSNPAHPQDFVAPPGAMTTGGGSIASGLSGSYPSRRTRA